MIVGQGVVGLLTMQLCKLSGADPVIAIDLLDERLDTAKAPWRRFCHSTPTTATSGAR